MLIKFSRKLINSFFVIILLSINSLSADTLKKVTKDNVQKINCALLINSNIPEKLELERCKYFEEVRKLKIENDRASGIPSWFNSLNIITPVIPSMTGIGMLFITFLVYRKDKKKNEDENKRDKARKEDERFNEILTQLGSNSSSIKASAASSLLIFTEPLYKRFWENILIITSANLKQNISFELKPTVEEYLTFVLQKTVKAKLEENVKFDKLNLSRTSVFRLNFEGLDFKNIEVDIAFAKMRYANFKGITILKLQGIGVCLNNAKLSRCKLHEARLNKSRCKNTQFHESVLTSATFKNADLRKAQFQRARLQSAHFEEADLRGANFTEANIDDAYFIGANLDETTKCSILKTYKRSWKKAHFDQDVKMELEQKTVV